MSARSLPLPIIIPTFKVPIHTPTLVPFLLSLPPNTLPLSSPLSSANSSTVSTGTLVANSTGGGCCWPGAPIDPVWKSRSWWPACLIWQRFYVTCTSSCDPPHLSNVNIDYRSFKITRHIHFDITDGSVKHIKTCCNKESVKFIWKVQWKRPKHSLYLEAWCPAQLWYYERLQEKTMAWARGGKGLENSSGCRRRPGGHAMIWKSHPILWESQPAMCSKQLHLTE